MYYELGILNKKDSTRKICCDFLKKEILGSQYTAFYKICTQLQQLCVRLDGFHTQKQPEQSQLFLFCVRLRFFHRYHRHTELDGHPADIGTITRERWNEGALSLPLDWITSERSTQDLRSLWFALSL